MIHLLIDPLPEEIEADGKRFPIVTDFRDWLRFGSMMGDRSLPVMDKLLLVREWFIKPPCRITAEIVQALRGFYAAGELEYHPRQSSGTEDAPRCPPTFSWEVDAPFLLGDFRRFYGMDLLRIEYLHWWEFKALFLALPADSRTMDRIHIRSMDLSKVSPERRSAIRRAQLQIALPFEVDEDGIADVFAEMM